MTRHGVSGGIFAITGGASGMGAATARLLAQHGAAAISIADINAHAFAALESSIKAVSPSTAVQCTVVDVTSAIEVEAWIGAVVARFGDLHGAANVAGLPQALGVRGGHGPNILSETDEEWRRTMGVNLDGVFYATRAEVRAMLGRQRQEKQQGQQQQPRAAGMGMVMAGHTRAIVNVASLSLMMHHPDAFVYGTSKAACAFFSACVAKDVSDFGIRVNCVSPGMTRTPMLEKFILTAKNQTALQEQLGLDAIEAEDVARTIVWLLSGDSAPVFGANINVGAGVP
ncbi:short chain dehydrogenase/oxidoreductase CpoX2 [Aspergillus carlsbadensis]|nr:short chain dehydrogenase/oxidoreductase CpoX2 [Aspergillus carlsbadensis]